MFKRIYVEITNRCNLSCSFCRPHNRELQEISAAQFEFILQQLKGETNHLYLHVKGEPLLHSQLEKLLNLCQQYGFQVNLTTNGTLLHKQQDILLNSPALRQINISVHSFPEQPLSFQEQYLNTLFSFAAQASTKMYLSFRFWNSKNMQPSPATEDLLQKIVCHFAGDNLTVETVIQQKRATLAKNIFLSFDEEFEWPALSNPYYGTNGTCYGLRQQLAILVDGTVVPCCLDGEGEAPLGNIFTTPLSEILATPLVQETQLGFEQNRRILPLCQHCSFLQRFEKKS